MINSWPSNQADCNNNRRNNNNREWELRPASNIIS